MKGILVIGPGDLRNKGAWAIMESLVEILNKAGMLTNCFFLSWAPEEDRSRMTNLDYVQNPVSFRRTKSDIIKEGSKAFHWLVWALMFRLFKINSEGLAPDKRNAQVFANSKCSIIASADLLSESYGFLSFAGNILGVLICVLLRKPLFFFSVQVGPFGPGLRGIIYKIFVKFIMKRCNFLSVRDQFSLAMLSSLGIEHAYFLPDLAFRLHANPTNNSHTGQSQKDSFAVGLVPSSLLSKHHKDLNPTTLFADISGWLLSKGLRVYLIPHVVLPNENNDHLLCTTIKGSHRNAKIIPCKNYRPSEIKALIASLDMLITARMHPAIHAVSSGVRCVIFDYNEKAKQLEILAPHLVRVVELNSLRFSVVKEQVDHLLSQEKKLKEKNIWTTSHEKTLTTALSLARAWVLPSEVVCPQRMTLSTRGARDGITVMVHEKALCCRQLGDDDNSSF